MPQDGQSGTPQGDNDGLDANERVAAGARERGFDVTARDVRYLRTKHVLSTGRRGRGNRLVFIPSEIDVVCAIEEAKRDTDYRRKFDRAVLIAYGNRADIGDLGLRDAYEKHFRRSEQKLDRLRNGERQRGDRDPDYADPLPPQLIATVLGDDVDPSSAQQLVELVGAVMPMLRGVAEWAHHELDHSDLNDEELAAKNEAQSFLEQLDDDPYLGFARLNKLDRNAKPEPLPRAYGFLEQITMRAFRAAARSADRQKMDQLRDAIVELRDFRVQEDSATPPLAVLLRDTPTRPLEVAAAVPMLLVSTETAAKLRPPQ